MGMSAIANDWTQAAGKTAPGIPQPWNRPTKHASSRPGSANLRPSPARRARPAPFPADRAPTAAGSLREAWQRAAAQCFTERMMLAVLTLCGMGAVVWAFLEVWLRLQNWPVFEAWVGRLWGA